MLTNTIKYLLITIFLLSYHVMVHAQGGNALLRRKDSLENLLKTQTDTARAFTLLRLADCYLRFNNGSDSIALRHSREAVKLFSKTGNGFGIAWSKFEEGTCLMDMRRPDEALAALNSAKDAHISDTVKRKNELLGTIWDQIAKVYDDQGELALSTDITLKKALPYFEAAKDQRRIAFTNASLGTSFLNLKQFDKAVTYYKKELLDYPGPKTESYFATDFSRLAFCLTQLKQIKEAKPFLDSALNILQAYPKSYPWIKYYDANANWYEKQGLHDQALTNYNAAVAVAQQINDSYNSINALGGKYEVLYSQRKFNEAKSVAYEIYNLKQSINDTIAFDKVDTYKMLYEIEKAVGNNTDALKWLERYSSLTDTMREREEKIKVNNLEVKYQAEKKEKEILKLQNTSRQQQLTLNENRLIVVSLVAVLLLAGLFLFIYFQIARNKNKLVVFNAILQGQENERKRLSTDLHDGLGGMISGIKLNLLGVTQSYPGYEQLQPIIIRIGDAVKELRRIAHNLMPENLLRFGLQAALTDLCERSQYPGTSVSFYASGLSPDLPQQEQLTIYRIVQELLSNAIKYASASEILVQCIQTKDQLSITVEDNGTGFDLDQLSEKNGMGLFNVKNRTKYLKGTMEINSGKDIGTTVNVNLKVSAHEKD